MAYTLTLIDTSSGGESCDFIAASAYEWRKGGFWCPPPPLRAEKHLLASDPEDRYENREVRISFKLSGADEDTIWSNAEALNRILRLARDQEDQRRTPTVELRWKSTGATNTSYFIVVGGSLDLGPIEHAWIVAKEFPDCTLLLECKPFARGVGIGAARTAVSLNNGSVGSKTTSPLVIWNHDDATAGHDNWADIVGADVDGDQAAPVEMLLTNNAASTNDLFRFRIAVRALGNPSNKNWFNAEDNESLGDSTTLADDARCPGTGGGGGVGQKAVCTFAVTAGEASRINWEITNALLDDYEGMWRVYLVARQTAGSDGDIDLRLLHYAGNDIYNDYTETEFVISGTSLGWLDLGLITIPGTPKDPAQGERELLTIRAGRNAGAGQLEIAGIVLFPVLYSDAFFVGSVESNASGGDIRNKDLEQGEDLHYRSVLEDYPGLFVCFGNEEVLQVAPRGSHIVLTPNENQRLFFGHGYTPVATGLKDSYNILDRLDVSVSYNPRFLHVRGA